MTNPFIVKGDIPSEYFCDRLTETEMLIKNITNGRNTLLISPRRVGKTGLIYHCFRQKAIADSYNTFFVDILQTSSLREFTYILGKRIFDTLKPQGKKVLDVFIQTLRSISGEFGYDPATNLPRFTLSLGAIHSPEYTLDEIFKYIDIADKRCVVAIDEFQQITRYSEKNVEAILRTHIQHCKNAEFIFAGSERHILTEMFNSYSRPFFASTISLSLSEIEKAKYTDFAEQCFVRFSKSIDREAAGRLYDLFSGNTYCLQLTLNKAFEKVNSGGTCTIDTIKESILDIMLEQQHSYQARLSILTPKPKELLIAIAKERMAERITSGEFVKRHRLSSSSSVQSAVKQLLSDDWISYETDMKGTKHYFLTDKFLSLWLLQEFGAGWTL